MALERRADKRRRSRSVLTSWRSQRADLLVPADPVREDQGAHIQGQNQEEPDKEVGDPDGGRVAGAPFLEEKHRHSDPPLSSPLAGQVCGVISCWRVMQL